MGKKLLSVAVVLFVAAATTGYAQEGVLHGSAELTYQSKYLWRGFDFFGSKSAVQTGVDLDLYQTGFGASVTMHRANSSGYENFERWDYSLYYSGVLQQDQEYETQYKVGWVYYNFPDSSSTEWDLQELYATISMPKICPGGFVPHYQVVYMWPSNGDQDKFNDFDGWMHIVGLGYDLTVPGILPEIAEQTLHLTADVVYNDGMGTGLRLRSSGSTVDIDHDWSHAVFGVSTEVDLGGNISFCPALYYQITMDDSVNDDKDETWATAGIKGTF